MASRSDGNNVSREINIRKLKDFVLRLPTTHPLRSVIMIEDDRMDVATFLARLSLWLRLSRIKSEP